MLNTGYVPMLGYVEFDMVPSFARGLRPEGLIDSGWTIILLCGARRQPPLRRVEALKEG